MSALHLEQSKRISRRNERRSSQVEGSNETACVDVVRYSGLFGLWLHGVHPRPKKNCNSSLVLKILPEFLPQLPIDAPDFLYLP